MTTKEELMESLKAMKKENEALKANVHIYDKLPALVFICEMTLKGDKGSLQLSYANHKMLEVCECSAEEFKNPGIDALKCKLHPDDKHLLTETIDQLCLHGQDHDCGNSFRLITHQEKVLWLSFCGSVYERHSDWTPKSFLFCGQVLSQSMPHSSQAINFAIDCSRAENSELIASLSNRQTEMLSLITQGLTSAEIAEKLFMSKRGVDSCRALLCDKLQKRNLALLVIFGYQNGFHKFKLESPAAKKK